MAGGGGLRRLRTKAREVGEGSRIGQAALARRDRQALLDLIVRAGFVDLEWYQAATGRTFSSEEQAAADYLGGDGRIPLNPLLASGRLGDLDRSEATNDAMVRYLLRGNLGYLPTAVFDDFAYVAANPGAGGHPGRARGHFLAAATADTLLPVPGSWAGEVPAFGPWRTQMINVAGQLAVREGRDDEALLVTRQVPKGEPSSTGADSVSLRAEPAADQPADSASEPAYEKFVTKSAELIDWRQLDAGLSDRNTDLISILIPTINDWRLTDAAVGALLRNSGDAGREVEIVVVDNGSDLDVAIGLAQVLIGRDPTLTRIRPIWLPRNLNFALGTNLAFAASSGAHIVLLNNDTEVCAGWLEPLLRELDDPDTVGVQPLLLYGDGTVQTAGTAFPDCGGLPSHLLVGHPAEDARRLGSFDVSAVTAAALAMRAGDYCELRGLDPRFINGFEDVDLCLRALERPGARFRVTTDSIVVHHESRTRTKTVTESNRRILWTEWRDRLPRPDMAGILERAGFAVMRWDPGVIGRAGMGRIPLPVLRRSRPAAADSSGAPGQVLRWAIKAPIDFRPTALRGAQDESGAARASVVAGKLAAALEALGQDVVVDCREAHERPTSGFDDVVVVLADGEPFEPQPGRPNLLWFWDGVPSDYDRFGFDLILERPASELTSAAMWLGRAEELLAAGVSWRSAHPELISD